MQEKEEKKSQREDNMIHDIFGTNKQGGDA